MPTCGGERASLFATPPSATRRLLEPNPTAMPHAIMRTPRALACAFALAAVTNICASPGQAAVPSSATASLDALRQAYLDAVKVRSIKALEALCDLSRLTPSELAEFRKNTIRDVFPRDIYTAEMAAPDPFKVSLIAKDHQKLHQPVIAELDVAFYTVPEQIYGVWEYVGSSNGRYYFLEPSKK